MNLNSILQRFVEHFANFESNLDMRLNSEEYKKTKPIKLCSVYEQERLASDSLVLHMIKKRIQKRPAGNRRIGLADIEEIENSVKRELNNERKEIHD